MSNDEIAVRNADQIERLPYEILKSMFPSVRYFVDGEVWVAKGYFSKENKYTRKRETVAMGEWQTRCNARAFPNPIQAAQWAELNYAKGHWRIRAYVPELHRTNNSNPNVISER